MCQENIRNVVLTRRTNWRNLGSFQKSNVLSEIKKRWDRKILPLYLERVDIKRTLCDVQAEKHHQDSHKPSVKYPRPTGYSLLPPLCFSLHGRHTHTQRRDALYSVSATQWSVETPKCPHTDTRSI